MAAKPKTAKVSWKYHHTIDEIDEWSKWVSDTALKFHEELLEFTTPANTGLAIIQTDVSIHLRTELKLVLKSIQKMERDVRRIKGRRPVIGRPS